MEQALRLLIIDDRQPDAELSASQIARGGYSCTWRRVETEEEFRTELREFAPDLILSDFTLPQYNGLAALELAVAEAPDVPFIFVSGTIGETRATEALNRGASDYVAKSDLTRLVPAVARALGVGQRKPRMRVGPRFSDNASLLDPLTGLAGRAFFAEHLSHHLRSAGKTEVATVIVFDVERLGEFNGTYGRSSGDRLLQCLAERLQRRFGEGAELAHFGGGTFAAVFAERRSGSDETRDSATAIFGQPFAVEDKPAQVTIKCGLARYPADGRDAETLLQCAEAALQGIREPRQPAPPEEIRGRREPPDPGSAQSPPRQPVSSQPVSSEPVSSQQGSPPSLSSRPVSSQPPPPEPVSPRRRATDARRGVLETRLRVAVQKQTLFLHYQPLIERVSGQVTAVEALLRWRDPELGLIAPGIFLPILERCGLMRRVGEWVLGQVSSDFDRWHRTGLPKLRIAVNISRSELGQKDFAAYFLDKTRREYTPPCVDIEIAESDLGMDLESLRQTLRTLRGEGVRIAVDDFGMTQASLSRLGELPVDSLKIDRSFVSRLTSQPQSQAMVTAIIALARSYGLRTVAEGVESIEQLKILDALGCEQSQGYLHSPAICAEELALLVASRCAD
jgi:diguanylate cyclase (GGDEF)-like protein